jgi:hypothetical protein
MNKQIKHLSIALLIALGCITTLKAQTKDEVQVVQGIWGMEKRAIITEYMKFTEAELAKFAPTYDMYAQEYQKLGAERIAIIGEYSQNYTTLTNEKADELMQKILKNNKAIDALQLKYYNKFKKEISAIRAAQFLQLELYIQTMIRAELQNSLPMIGELDKIAK